MQAKLTLGRPNNRFEQEAETAADKVTTGEPAPPISPLPSTRLEEDLPEDTDVQRQVADEEELVQTKTGAGSQRAETAAAGTTTNAVRAPGPGKPLSPGIRQRLGPAFGADFNSVRIHNDTTAQETARALGAKAFTHQNHIWLGPGQTPEDSHLMAHELTHVVQQKGRAGIIQRQAVEGGGATPGSGEGIDLIFIIKAPDDEYTRDVTQYVKTVLAGQHYVEVDNLDDIFSYLETLRPTKGSTIWERAASPETAVPPKPGQKVRRIRIVAHGSTTGDVKLTPKGEGDRRWFKPEEVKAYAGKVRTRQTIADVMTPDAVVEFWGCNIGSVTQAGEAWSKLFRSKFKATSETFKTGFDKYYRPAGRGERGETFPGQQGRWVQVTSTNEVDSRGRGLQRHFRQWLLDRYNELVVNGDILPVKDEDAQVATMRDLFDRSGGDIRHIVIEKHDDASTMRPGNTAEWQKVWMTTKPLTIWDKALEASDK